jgi:hypothetical protein
MAEKKITKREVINTMLADERIASNEVYVAYLKHELELLDKKAEKKADSKKSVENADIKEVILETLARIGKGTVTEIQSADARIGLDVYRNQKISAVLKQMIENDKTVVKSTEGRKSVFTLA